MNNQTKSEAEIGNILLAEFMGWGESGIYHTPFEDAGMCNGELSSICYDRNLRFNSDWNWLMLVVEKIESFGFRFEIALNEVDLYDIENDRFSTAVNFPDRDGLKDRCLTKIHAAFLACVEFAKWYKTNSHE